MIKILQAMLIRPLVVFDLETTGTDIYNDRIVEICILKLEPNGHSEIKTKRINPGIAIPSSASDVHGITYDMVKDEPKFASFAKGIYQLIKGADIATFNGNRFDIPLLAREFKRAEIDFSIKDVNVIDVRNLYLQQFPRDLKSAYHQYTGKEIENAHTADADVKATFEILQHQINSLENLPDSIEKLAVLSNFGNEAIDVEGWFQYDVTGTIILFAKGKFKGKPITTDKSYLNWMAFKMTPSPLQDVIDIIIPLITT